MRPQKSTRPRYRVRSAAEQMWWDSATPAERVAFTLGYACGQGVDFPPPHHIEALRASLGATTRRTAGPRRKMARTPDGKRFSYDLAEVARIARAAIAEGRSAATAVFETIPECASRNAAGVAITKARQAGHDIPYQQQWGGAT